MRLEGEGKDGVVYGAVPVGFRVMLRLAFARGLDKLLELGPRGTWPEGQGGRTGLGIPDRLGETPKKQRVIEQVACDVVAQLGPDKVFVGIQVLQLDGEVVEQWRWLAGVVAKVGELGSTDGDEPKTMGYGDDA